jgi:hypothetical protein
MIEHPALIREMIIIKDYLVSNIDMVATWGGWGHNPFAPQTGGEL